MISIIIPTYNESRHIEPVITHVRSHVNAQHEIIVSDGGSTDDTLEKVRALHVNIVISAKGRARQMNAGAKNASYDILYFLHADSFPPPDFGKQITAEIQGGRSAGCYRLKFDHDHWFLAANCWFTRFDVNSVRFGDQSLFVRKDIFERINGFREDLLMMEDQEIISRIKKNGSFKVMRDAVTTSARKYMDNGVYRMQGIFFVIWALYYLGYSQEKLLRLHKHLITGHKL